MNESEELYYGYIKDDREDKLYIMIRYENEGERRGRTFDRRRRTSSLQAIRCLCRCCWRVSQA